MKRFRLLVPALGAALVAAAGAGEIRYLPSAGVAPDWFGEYQYHLVLLSQRGHYS